MFFCIQIYPKGIRKLINWLKKEYGSPEFMIFENGFADNKLSLDDDGRVEYYEEHLKQVR
jgi:beta-glucosidase/6-phospho-beta-glucosidase/beta-galactosidase